MLMWKLLLAGLIVMTAVPARGDPGSAPRAAALRGLTVTGGDYSAPSHGGLEFIGSAHFVLTNPTGQPIRVAATIELCADVGCLPLQIEKLETDDPKSRALTIPAHGRQLLRIRAGLGVQRALYHVRYWHQATFTSGSERVVVSAGNLYFRPPHPMRR